MRILVTGAAGFIGYHTCLKLIEQGFRVIGIDNINDYYSKKLKFDRLSALGIEEDELNFSDQYYESNKYKNFTFLRVDLTNKKELSRILSHYSIGLVCNLAAQAGVRYSIDNPDSYIQSNIIGFHNLLEAIRYSSVKHFIYASSSSVYGNNEKVPFSVSDKVDCPISLYAATKKSNELMAHSYSSLYGITTTGIRFFTVYGPWGRPDMAYYMFSKSILENKPIKLFNNGNMERDFTYIDDVVDGLLNIIRSSTLNRECYKIYNLGNTNTVKLEYFVKVLEEKIGKNAIKKYMPMQLGDVKKTWADMDLFKRDFEFSPKTTIEDGLENFVKWFLNYHDKFDK